MNWHQTSETTYTAGSYRIRYRPTQYGWRWCAYWAGDDLELLSLSRSPAEAQAACEEHSMRSEA